MTAANTQVVKAYEDCGMLPSEIAETLGWEESAIKAILAIHSRKYRSDTKDLGGPLEVSSNAIQKVDREGESGAEDVEITDPEYQEIISAYKQLALYSEVDSVRERALRNLIDEKKGRKRILSPSKVGSLNIAQINVYIKQAREELRGMIEGINPINIEAEVKQLKQG
jgi:cyanate lyase